MLLDYCNILMRFLETSIPIKQKHLSVIHLMCTEVLFLYYLFFLLIPKLMQRNLELLDQLRQRIADHHFSRFLYVSIHWAPNDIFPHLSRNTIQARTLSRWILS